jgi:hypothetical protein
MRICILCEDSKLTAVREKMNSSNILNTPLSESGNLPATYWFCCIATTQDVADKMLAQAELTTMEISEPKPFLTKWNLQIIKS